jgi:hypothetical protein
MAGIAKAIDDINDEIRSIQSEPLPVDQSASRRDWEQNIEDVTKDIGTQERFLFL